MKRKVLILISTLVLIVTIAIITITYAIFESRLEGNITVESATWKILVNRTDISSGQTQEFVVDRININGDSHTTEGKIAPGQSGSFDILIDPNNTDVSVRYDIQLDLSFIEDTKMEITSIEETEKKATLIKTAENTYTGVIPLNEIRYGTRNNIRISLMWYEDESTNERDTEIGSVENNAINIPISVKVTQYLGEEIQSI